MIRANSEDGHTEVLIHGDSHEVLNELLAIVLQVLKAFYQAGCANAVMKGLVDVTGEFISSINDTNF